MPRTRAGARPRGGTRLAALLLVALGLALSSSPAAVAADITVGGACDLVEAVSNANDAVTGSSTTDCVAGDPAGADTILLTGDVVLTAALAGLDSALEVTSEIRLDGNGFVIERSSASPRFRIFEVTSAGNLTLEDVEVSRGRDDQGGGIFNDGGVVTIRDSHLRRHRAVGGSPNRGGAIYNDSGTLAVVDTTISGNDAVATAVADGEGGAIYTQGAGTVSVTNSALFNNTATDGAGTRGDGGAIAVRTTMVTITNSTISGNIAGGTGGALLAASGSTLIYDSTIFGNTPSDDSIQAPLTGGLPPMCIERVSLLNTIVDPPETGGCDCTIIDGGASFGCATTVTNVDPALTDNGGPTSTHALLAGSNAIDVAGDCAAIDPILALDQRGAPRFDGTCDAGSFEFGGCPLLVLDEPIGPTDSFEECEIQLTATFGIFAPGGDLTLTGGSRIVVEDGVQIDVAPGGAVIFAIDGDLQVSSALEEAAKAGFRMPTTR